MAYDAAHLELPTNQVRYHLGGPLTDAVLLDAEITARLPGGFMACGSTIEAAIACGDYLITKAGWAVDISEGGASASLSQLAPQLRELVASLRRQVPGSSSAAAMLSTFTQDDCGNTRPRAFTRTLGDAPGAADWP